MAPASHHDVTNLICLFWWPNTIKEPDVILTFPIIKLKYNFLAFCINILCCGAIYRGDGMFCMMYLCMCGNYYLRPCCGAQCVTLLWGIYLYTHICPGTLSEKECPTNVYFVVGYILVYTYMPRNATLFFL